MVHSCITPPWEEGSHLTSGHRSVRPTTLQPGCARYTFPMFSFTIQWLLGSALWCYSQVINDTKRCIFTCLCNGVSSFCPMKSPTPVLSQKELKNDNRRYAWLLLWQGHGFLHWIWARQVVLNQLAGRGWFIASGFTAVKLGHIMCDAWYPYLIFIPAPDALETGQFV